MKCQKCGYENVQNAKFCAKCGTPVYKPQPPIQEKPPYPIMPNDSSDNNGTKKKKKRNIIIISIIAVLLVIGIIAGLIFANKFIQKRSYDAHITNGINFMNAFDYDQAETEFLLAIDLEPHRPEAYKYLIDVYIETERYDDALDILEQASKNVPTYDQDDDFKEKEDRINKMIAENSPQDGLSVKESETSGESESDPVIEITDQNSLIEANDMIIEQVEQGELEVIEGYVFDSEQWYILGSVAGAMKQELTYDDMMTDDDYINIGTITNRKRLNCLNTLFYEAYYHMVSYGDYSIGDNYLESYVSRSDLDKISVNLYGIPAEKMNEEYMVVKEDGYYFSLGQGAPSECMYPYKYYQCGDTLITECCLGSFGDTGSSFYTKRYSVIWAADDHSEFGYRLAAIKQLPYTKLIDHIDSVKASSVLKESGSPSSKYQAKNVIDGNMKTAWVEGVSGDGILENIILDFDKKQKVHGVIIAPGYAKSDTVYTENSVPTMIRIEMDNGASIDVDLEQNDYPHTIKVDDIVVASTWEGIYIGNENVDFEYELGSLSGISVFFSNEYVTDSIKISILEVRKGTVYEDTCISEIYPF